MFLLQDLACNIFIIAYLLHRGRIEPELVAQDECALFILSQAERPVIGITAERDIFLCADLIYYLYVTAFAVVQCILIAS